ncbi:hypothetical protein PROFUN_00880 [Planoprotostelium fungivorum]|uniref:Uncharacterized protein n=1 Tax=Planoprotostelium fungivorum TaxID=1890364 RepID=A0A2P6P075_9EUKA|nr:hypothetical protein PROFUN_00880 [Planoprotostelium fungivorum]
MEGKRKEPEATTGGALVIKKQKTEEDAPTSKKQLISNIPTDAAKALMHIKRTSSLQAPIMLLSGHQAEVYSVRFNHTGSLLCSSSFDKCVYVWNTYGDCDNTMVLKGHASAVLDSCFSHDSTLIFSASADKTLAVWDAETGTRIKKYQGHTSFVNSCSATRRGAHLVVTTSDDSTVRLWDTRKRHAITSYDSQYAATSACFSADSEQIFSAGIDNDIKVWSVREGGIENRFEGHTDTVTGIRLSPDGNYLLTNAMDDTVRIFDVKPYVKGNRCVKVFQGAQHNFEKNLLRCAWSPDGSRISAGSSDRLVNIWDANTTKVLYKLPGHRGSVNDVDFHPTEPIIASASSDNNIYLGEIKL